VASARPVAIPCFAALRAGLLAALLAGCSTMIHQEDILASWYGAPAEALVAQWGAPTEERVVAGRRVLIWRRGTPPRPGFHPSIVIAKDAASAPETAAMLDDWCERTMEVNPRGVVVGGEFVGAGCPIYERADRARLYNRSRPPPR